MDSSFAEPFEVAGWKVARWVPALKLAADDWVRLEPDGAVTVLRRGGRWEGVVRGEA